MTIQVIGAGLSGLATAWFLAERGARVRVIEAAGRPGGLIRTERVPEGLVEWAARAFTWTPPIEALFTRLDVAPVYARDESKRRYLFRNGKPTRWPLTQLETLGAGARLLRAWAGRQMDARDTETVAEWGARVLGPPATTWLLAPALQGIYASPPEDLSASAIFGKDRPKGGKLAAPPGGMGELMDRLHHALHERGVVFDFGRAADPSDIDASRPAVICTNAPAAARLLEPHAPQLAAAVGRIRMVSMLAVHAFFAPHAADLHGFGVLFPRSSGVHALGAVFNAEVFAARSEMRSETWMYGALDAAALPHTDADAIRQMALDRRVLTGRSDPPAACYVTRQPHALPVYDTAVLHARAALDSLPAHIAVAGNYLGRLGVSNLVVGAAEAAGRLAIAEG
jgi:oxygen-dependent protoporphyrinogen oxidase